MIGKLCYITDPESFYCGEWGMIIEVDEDGMIYVAVANGTDSVPVFDKTQIKIRRKQNEKDH